LQSTHTPLRWLKLVFSCLAIVLSLFIVLSVLGASASMHIPRLSLDASPASYGLPFQEISFASRLDYVNLKGWLLPSTGKSVVVFINGGFQNRADPTIPTLGVARDLVSRGYNVLLFDLRGRGESGGTGYSLLNADKDIGGAVDYLKSLGFSINSIGIIGYCSGAANTTMFASREHVGALVLDGCFTSVRGMVENSAAYRHIPRFFVNLFLPGVQLAAAIIYSYQRPGPEDVICNIDSPILFIHEEGDRLVTIEDGRKLLALSKDPTNQLWEVPRVEHNQAYAINHARYVSTIADFFDKSLSGSN